MTPERRAARWVRKLRARGPVWAAKAAIARIRPPRASNAERVRTVVAQAAALEIGGPSHAFHVGGILPLYDVLATLDIVDFAERTPWTDSGETDRTDPRLPDGRLIVGEAGDLGGVPDRAYDLVLSSHVLEHLADPIGAVREWRRVLRSGGLLIAIIPLGSETFDRRRATTAVSHMTSDVGRPETDDTHFDDLLTHYDFSRSEFALTPDQLRELVVNNQLTRFAHHHVFDARSGRDVLEAGGLSVDSSQFVWPMHLLYIARTRGHRSR